MNVQTLDGVVYYCAGMNIDGDGCPRCYAPANSGLHPLDYLANAGSPGNYYGLVCDAHGTPYVQGPNDPHPGFYLSPTALQDHTKAANDPARYVDSENVCYIAVPPELKQFGVRLGDYCVVFFNHMMTYGIVADIGPHGKLGEASIATANQLSIPSSPKNGGVDKGVTYLILPGTGAGWANFDYASKAEDAFNAWGGLPKVKSAGII